MPLTEQRNLTRRHGFPETQSAAGLPADGEESHLSSLDRLADNQVALADGSVHALDGLTRDDLRALQWQQEREFARRILAAPKGSSERSRVTCQAYSSVTRILARVHGNMDRPLVMGMHPRQGRLVLDLLRRQQERGQSARFFEIGYGTGTLLKIVADAGFPMAGIEVASAMRQQAVEQIGLQHASRLHLGDFLTCKAPLADGPWSLVYWNDVFEHIPPDEIGDWLQRIHEMLTPGGQLVTITPNWHCRPSDVTVAVCPPRTVAAGLHLKEYTLVEVSDMLRRAGFARVATPLVVLPRQVALCGSGLIGLKRRLEPILEWLPFRFAKLLCRGMGLTCTVATKGYSHSQRMRPAPRTPLTENAANVTSTKDAAHPFQGVPHG
jgi:SAM-dependent methyltransferase